jgi:hypothetical protein
VIPSRRWIERLVEQQQLRPHRQRPGQRHALLLAARQLVGVARAEVRQMDDRQHFLHAAGRLRL